MDRIPASERTREKLKALMEGRSEVADGRSELVRLAARLIVARRSGWESVLPHRGMFPRRQALPHQARSRCLIDPPAEPQLLF